MAEKNYVEVSLYNLNDGVEEAHFLSVSDKATDVFRDCDGFMRRELLKNDDGKWVDLVYWANQRMAKAAEARLYSDETIAELMGQLNTETMIFVHVEPERSYAQNEEQYHG